MNVFDARMMQGQMTGTARTIREWLPIVPDDMRIVVSRSTHQCAVDRGVSIHRIPDSPRALAIEGATCRLVGDVVVQPWMFGALGRHLTVLGVYDLIPLQLGTLKRRLLLSRLAEVRRNERIRVITLAEATATCLAANFGVPRERVIVCRPGAQSPQDSKDQLLPSEWGRSEGHVLAVGRVSSHKNFSTLVSAWRRGIHPQLILVVPKRDLGSRQVRAWKSKGVDVRSGLSDGELANLLRSAAVVACPSLEEGYGLPLAEAAVMQRPIIASDIAVFRELPLSGVTWVPPLAVQAWSEALSAVDVLTVARWAEPPPTWETWRADVQGAMA